MTVLRNDADLCARCRGIGQAVKRLTCRKDGSVSTITYDLKAHCVACKGTGLAVMERSVEHVS